MTEQLKSDFCSVDDSRDVIGKKDKLKSVVYGAAIGDALGVPYEFSYADCTACVH